MTLLDVTQAPRPHCVVEGPAKKPTLERPAAKDQYDIGRLVKRLSGLSPRYVGVARAYSNTSSAAEAAKELCVRVRTAQTYLADLCELLSLDPGESRAAKLDTIAQVYRAYAEDHPEAADEDEYDIGALADMVPDFPARRREIFELRAQGVIIGDIAIRTGQAVRTVNDHLNKIHRAFGTHNISSYRLKSRVLADVYRTCKERAILLGVPRRDELIAAFDEFTQRLVRHGLEIEGMGLLAKRNDGNKTLLIFGTKG